MKPAPHTESFRAWFAIGPTAAALLAELYVAKGLTVRHEYLCVRLGVTRYGLRARAYDLHVAMDPGSIVAVSGTGYRLTSIGTADCERAIRDAQDFTARDGAGAKNLSPVSL